MCQPVSTSFECALKFLLREYYYYYYYYCMYPFTAPRCTLKARNRSQVVSTKHQALGAIPDHPVSYTYTHTHITCMQYAHGLPDPTPLESLV